MLFRSNSLADYQAVFGAEFDPVYDINAVADATKDPYDFSGLKWDAASKTYKPAYYALARSTSVSVQENRGTEGGPAIVPEVDAGAAGAAKPALAAFNLYNSVRLFYANGGGTCYVVSVGDYTANGTKKGGVAIDKKQLETGLAAAGEQSGPTMLVIPDAVLLPKSSDQTNLPYSTDFQDLTRAMLGQCAKLQDRVAVLDVYGTEAVDPTKPKNGTFDNDVTAVIDNFQQAVGGNFLNYGMAYFPFLVTSIIAPSEVSYINFNIGDATQKKLVEDILTDQASYQYPDLDSDGNRKSPADNKNPTFLAVKKMIDDIPTTVTSTTPEGMAAITTLNQNLVNALALLQQMENAATAKMSMQPASGAMAGIFTFNDATRGVWNAPANMVLDSVVQPSLKLNGDQQGPLNVPLNGKAVNVIREFVGRGPVVWGARTLDGNSNDWRYVQVRRTIVYVEQSIKAALNMFVFAPNTGTTWVAVTAMVSGFLTNLWQQGGLMGAKPDEAFSVQCGLGSTMTGIDVLEGYMIVQVTLQMIRPAEFIELTFKQKMQGVA